MTDDERLARLTKLACVAYRNAGLTAVEHELHDGHMGYEVLGDVEDGLMVFVRSHPRALDALEAALLVLAQEPSPEVEERHAKLVAVADKLSNLRRWIEGFARELEQRAGRLDRSHAAMGKAFALREVAAELRERAKEGR